MKDKKKHSKHDDALTDEEEALLKSYALLGQVKAALAAQKATEATAEGAQSNANATQAGVQRSTSVNDGKQNEPSVDAAQATEQARRLVQSGVIKLRIAEPTQIIAARSAKARRGRKTEGEANAVDSSRASAEQLERQAQLRKAHTQFVRSTASRTESVDSIGESDSLADRDVKQSTGRERSDSGPRDDYFDFFGRFESDRQDDSSGTNRPRDSSKAAGNESDSEDRGGNRGDRSAGNLPTNNTVFVECNGLAQSDLARAAGNVGELVSLRYDEARGRAFLTYTSRNDALRAIDELDKAVIRGVFLRADFVRPMQRQNDGGSSDRGYRGRPFRGRGRGRGGRPFRGGPFRSPQRGGLGYGSPPNADRGPYGDRSERRARNDSESGEAAIASSGRRDDAGDVGTSFIPNTDDNGDGDEYDSYFEPPTRNVADYDNAPVRRGGFYAEAPADADGDNEGDWDQVYGYGNDKRASGGRDQAQEANEEDADVGRSGAKRMRGASSSYNEQLQDDSAAVRREGEAEQMQSGWMNALNKGGWKRRPK